MTKETYVKAHTICNALIVVENKLQQAVELSKLTVRLTSPNNCTLQFEYSGDMAAQIMEPVVASLLAKQAALESELAAL